MNAIGNIIGVSINGPGLDLKNHHYSHSLMVVTMDLELVDTQF